MKDITGYEGLYAVTSCGKVWSYKSQKFLRPLKQKTGYYQVNLYKEGKMFHFYVHRLVAATYLDNPAELAEVNHCDENKANNALTNLEWVSSAANSNYGTRNARIASKAQKKRVYCIELDKTFDSITHASKELNLYASNLSGALNGRYKTAGGYHWQYV